MTALGPRADHHSQVTVWAWFGGQGSLPGQGWFE